MLATTAIALTLLAPPAARGAGAAEALAAAEAHFARRAEGSRDGVARPEPVEAAIVAYRRALALDHRSYAVRLGLLRAIFFRTGFCEEMAPAAKRRQLEEAKTLADETLRQLERERKIGRDGLPVGEVYLWTAVSWGQWVVFHKLAVAFEGALTKIRLMAETAAGIDPALDQAGALVILGRLHSEAPRIPLLTGWVSRRSGIAYLRRALAIAPENPACLYFLADALLESDPNGHDEAQALLERCAELLPRADSPVEDLHYVQMARARLARPNLRL